MDNFDNLGAGSEEEEGLIEAFMSHDDEEEPEQEPTAESRDEGESAPEAESEDDSEESGESEESEASDESESDEEGESDDSSESDDSEEAEPETFTVKIDGEEQSVTRDELVKGYMKDADYRRKTAEVAEERKKLKSEEAERLQKLDERLQELDSLVETDEQETDWDELRQFDPSEYMRRKELLEQRQQKRDQARQEKQQQEAQKMQELKQQEAERLTAAIPDWLDAETRKQEMGELRQELVNEYGFAEQEVNSLLDHRLVKLARDAWKGKQAQQKLEKRTAEAKRKVQKAPPAQKPKSSGGKPSQEERTKELQRRARDGDDDAAVELFEMGL